MSPKTKKIESDGKKMVWTTDVTLAFLIAAVKQWIPVAVADEEWEAIAAAMGDDFLGKGDVVGYVHYFVAYV